MTRFKKILVTITLLLALPTPVAADPPGVRVRDCKAIPSGGGYACVTAGTGGNRVLHVVGSGVGNGVRVHVVTPAEEIRAQRKAILTGRWVRKSPGTGQACLVERVMDHIKWTRLSLTAMRYVQEAIWALHPGSSPMTAAPWAATTAWNDHICPDEHTALTVLEYAEKLAERDEA